MWDKLQNEYTRYPRTSIDAIGVIRLKQFLVTKITLLLILTRQRLAKDL